VDGPDAPDRRDPPGGGGGQQREQELAAMNEALGVTTLLVPARPELTTMSSTAVRALRA
jgi:hypothetical protein